MNNDDKIRKIADHYGMESQMDIMQEECAELIQAVSKFRRAGLSKMLEEMADVTIMVQQVLYLLNKRTSSFGISAYDAFYEFIDKKLDRQIKRIEEEG